MCPALAPALPRHLLWLYLLWQDPWYSVLAEWDEKMEDEDEDEDEDEVANKEGSKVEIEVLVKREGDESYSMVPWRLSNTYHVPRTYEPRAYIYFTGVLVPLAARRQLADRLDEHRLSPRECVRCEPGAGR